MNSSLNRPLINNDGTKIQIFDEEESKVVEEYVMLNNFDLTSVVTISEYKLLVEYVALIADKDKLEKYLTTEIL